MTTTFDALLRLISEYKDVMSEDDYNILRDFIETIHSLQHSENSHRIDGLIERRIAGTSWNKRFQEIRRPSYEPKRK